MRPNGFNRLTVCHPNTSHEGKVEVEVAGFSMAKQAELGDPGTKAHFAQVEMLRSCILQQPLAKS